MEATGSTYPRSTTKHPLLDPMSSLLESFAAARAQVIDCHRHMVLSSEANLWFQASYNPYPELVTPTASPSL
eukprot:131012-Ditylum_brightwellii.AAC.1